jgi:hypothetical protein
MTPKESSPCGEAPRWLLDGGRVADKRVHGDGGARVARLWQLVLEDSRVWDCEGKSGAEHGGTLYRVEGSPRRAGPRPGARRADSGSGSLPRSVSDPRSGMTSGTCTSAVAGSGGASWAALGRKDTAGCGRQERRRSGDGAEGARPDFAS